MIPVYITAVLLAVAAVTLATSFAANELGLVTVSIVGSVLAGVALAWTCLLNTSGGADKISQTSPAPSEGISERTGSEFPIEDYDDLRVDEVLPLLQELDPSGLKMVQLREEIGPGRRAILARVEGLLELHDVEEPEARFPIDGYDRMRVVDILPLLKNLAPAELDVVAWHEQQTAGRRTVLLRIARLQERKQPLDETARRGGVSP
jgi:hypothetical protein